MTWNISAYVRRKISAGFCSHLLENNLIIGVQNPCSQGILCSENACKNSTTGCFCSKCGWINTCSVMTFNFITQTSLFSFFLSLSFSLFDFLLSRQIILQSDFLYQTWAWLIVIIPIYVLYDFYRYMKMTRSDWLTCNTSLAWKVGAASDTNWATSRKNMSSGTFDQA